MKIVKVVAASLVSSALSSAYGESKDNTVKVLVLNASEYQVYKSLGHIKKNQNTESVKMSRSLYETLKESGRIVKVDAIESTNCIGNLTD